MMNKSVMAFMLMVFITIIAASSVPAADGQYAVVKNGMVEKVIICDKAPKILNSVVVDVSSWPGQRPGPGWTYAAGVFSEPPEPPAKKADKQLGVLSVDRWFVPADGVSKITVTYTAKETVCFIVDGAAQIVEPADKVATLEITASDPGIIRVDVRGQSVVLAAVAP